MVLAGFLTVAAGACSPVPDDAYLERAPIAPGGGVDARYVVLSPPTDPTDPTTLEPDDVPPTGGHDGVESLTQSRYTFANPNGPVSLVRNTSGGYVIGSALNGWTFDVVNKGSGTWYRGTIYGNYNNCGFALAANIAPKTGTAHSTCDVNWQAPPLSFASRFNCSSCGAGQAVRLTGSVNRFLNVQALNGGVGPFTDNRGQLPANTCVEWRYVTRNGQWVMAKWRGADDNHGSWAFMERSSFPATLPNGSAACP